MGKATRPFRRRLRGLEQLSLLVLFTLVFGCVRSIPSAIPLDSPEYSYSNGLKFLEKGEYENALLEFERARAKDPQYAPAYVGIALVKAAREEFQAAFTALEKAKALDGAMVRAAAIRILSSQQGERWLQSAEKEFEAGRSQDPLNPALYFYMGKAYEKAYAFEKAASMFRRVLAMNRGFSEEAILALRRLERIQKANPSTPVGKKVALLEKVTRGDVAVLLVEELKLDARIPASPEAVSTSLGSPLVTDLRGHPFRSQIEAVIRKGLRGLKPFPDHTFAPEKPISRADFAIILEDVFIRLKGGKGENARPPRFLSPFLDVPTDHYAFNAVMFLTLEKILEPRPDDRFGPKEPLSGIEAVWAISRLKEELK